MSYPKWLYHKTEKPVLLENEEQEAALGKGWEDTPAAFLAPEKEMIKEESGHKGHKEDEPIEKMNKAELIALLVEAGKTEAELKGLNKAELIALLGAE